MELLSSCHQEVGGERKEEEVEEEEDGEEDERPRTGEMDSVVFVELIGTVRCLLGIQDSLFMCLSWESETWVDKNFWSL